MSSFFSSRFSKLVPYVPGEQPQDRKYIKLNTNESPFPPSPGVRQAVLRECDRLQLYCDPECTELMDTLCDHLGVCKEELLLTNGSDEALNFIFMAYGDNKHPFSFPDLTYGFYPVFCALHNLPWETKALREDYRLSLTDYLEEKSHVVIANPNAPTGMTVPVHMIEQFLMANPRRLMIVDEAYVAFGADTCLPLIRRFDNVLVVRTFSKSHSLAGARLGYILGPEPLITDLRTLKYSTNPYNVNRMTQAAGVAAIRENDYYAANCQKIIANRESTREALQKLGFEVLPSEANFLFARRPGTSGQALYERLRERGVLVRHFNTRRARDFLRITIGSAEQMDIFLQRLQDVLQEMPCETL